MPAKKFKPVAARLPDGNGRRRIVRRMLVKYHVQADIDFLEDIIKRSRLQAAQSVVLFWTGRKGEKVEVKVTPAEHRRLNQISKKSNLLISQLFRK